MTRKKITGKIMLLGLIILICTSFVYNRTYFFLRAETTKNDILEPVPWNQLSFRWGTHVPNKFGGVRNRDHEMLSVAFLWYSPDNPLKVIREDYGVRSPWGPRAVEEHAEKLEFHWTLHDSRSGIANFDVSDPQVGFNLNFTFARYDNSSMVYRVKAQRISTYNWLSVFPHVYVSGDLSGKCDIFYDTENQSIIVEKPDGYFIMYTPNSQIYQVGSVDRVYKLMDGRVGEDILENGNLTKRSSSAGTDNYGIVQYLLHFTEENSEKEFTIVLLETDNLKDSIEKARKILKNADAIIEARKDDFLSKFDLIHDGAEKALVIHAVSELFGNLAYFYGNETFDYRNKGQYGKVIRTTELFTIVPTKTGFPRGFLWDDMFHQLLVMRYDPKLTKEVIRSWLSFMDDDGWIHREVTIGAEADEYTPDWAAFCDWPECNPPVIFYTVWRYYQEHSDIDFLHEVYPLLKVHYQFFLDTHDADGDHMFNWVVRGLESGMDNFPRPVPENEHVDLTAWMYMAATRMREMAKALGLTSDYKFYDSEAQKIMDNLQLFWNNGMRFYVDLGYADEPYDSIGYPGILPFVFGASSPEKADEIMKHLTNPSKLWTAGGIRSLSKTDRDYIPHYWAGDIWININYLIVVGLEELGYNQLSQTLRWNIVSNMLSEFDRTGYIWEVYDGNTLKGKYNHCFAGWSAFVALMIPAPPPPPDADNDSLPDYWLSLLLLGIIIAIVAITVIIGFLPYRKKRGFTAQSAYISYAGIKDRKGRGKG